MNALTHWLTNTPAGFVLTLVAGTLVMATIYVTPTILAWSQHCKKLGLILILNLFLGWTVIVWIGLLAWPVFCGDNLNEDECDG